MVLVLLLSSIMGISSNSWLLAWVALEVNALCMCFIISKENNKSKKASGMKYFTVQVLSSGVIIINCLTSLSEFNIIAISMAILMKMGVWPMHIWYMNILQSLKIESNSFILILTWQKILPLWLLMTMSTNSDMTLTLIFLCMALSTLLPMLKSSNSMSKKDILILSSINNSSWLLMGVVCSLGVMLTFLFFYCVSTMLFTEMMENNKKSMSKKSFEEWTNVVNIMNMGGLPPYSMFWVKMMVIYKSLEKGFPLEIICMMLVLACLMAYLYLMSGMEMMMKTPKKNQYKNMKSQMMMLKLHILSVASFLLLV